MGVPNFYTWLVRRYPLCLYDYPSQVTDFLYMDLNQVIYKCATDPTILFKDQLGLHNFEDLWVSILNYIDSIITRVSPQKLIFLALDGVAPRAKMNQQRQRRFQSQKRYAYLSTKLKEVGLFAQNETYKNNQFSPGTEFMTELNQQIKFYIEKKYNEDPKWRTLKVIFSGCDVPGEGEHKLLSFMRNISNDQNFTHLIYGADADLIMLGLSLRLKNVSIIRENLKQKYEVSAAARRIEKVPEYQCINLQIVKEYLALEYESIRNEMKIQYDLNRIIDDFILLCFFVGNDFLPRIYCFDIRIGTIEPLVELFKQHLKKCENYIVDKGQINFIELLKLVDLLQGFEKLCINDRENEMKQYLENDEIKKEHQLIDKILELSKIEETDGRKFYYKMKCQIMKQNDQLDLEKLEEMIVKYIEGIQFVLLYYFQGVPSWEWYYPFYYAPLCGDIFALLQRIVQTINNNESHNNEVIKLDKGQPYPPYKQLLSILTPGNASLLPPQYAKLLTDIENSPLRTPIDYYPDKFETDSYGAIFEHQHIAKIPFVDANIVEQAYSSIPITDDPRNQQNNAICYKYEENKKIYISTIPQIIQDFESCTYSNIIDVENKDECQQFIIDLKKEEKEQFQLPSLNVIQIKNSKLKDIEDDDKKFFNQLIEIEIEKTNNFDYPSFSSDLNDSNNFIFCGFPIMKKVEVSAIIKPDMIKFFTKQTIQMLENYSKKDHQQFYQKIRNKLINQYEKLGLKLDASIILIVKHFKYAMRDNDNKFVFPKDRYIEVAYPYEFAYMKNIVDYTPPILEEFQIGKQVIIFHEKFNGAKGIIKEIQKKISVQIKSIPPQADYQYQHSDRYYSLQFVSEKLQCPRNTILNILGSVVVEMDDSKESKIADALDIGLNIINRTANKLVPELVRLPQADQYAKGYEKYQQFMDLELSEECVNLLCQYRNQCHKVQIFLARIKENLKQFTIKAVDIFTKVPDANIELLKLYIWILQLPSSQYLLQGSASKVAKLTVTVQPQGQINNNLTKKIDSGFAVQYNQTYPFPPFFIKHPAIHKIGDRVVSLKHPFGIYGTVVGLLDKDEILVQVLWDQKYFGFTNLGGRYPLLSCSICKFTDVFNISNEDWRKSLVPFGQHKGEYWDLFTKIYIPDFKSKPISDTQSLHQQNPFTQLEELPQQQQIKVVVKKPQVMTDPVLQQVLDLSAIQNNSALITTDPIEGKTEEEILREEKTQKQLEQLFLQAEQQEQQQQQQQIDIQQNLQQQEQQQCEMKQQIKQQKVLQKKKN